MQTGGTPDTYVALQDTEFHIGRPVFREVATNGGVTYFFGASENWLEGTLLLSTTEWSTWNTLTQRTANGDLTSTAYKVKATNLNGTSVTASFNAKVLWMRTSKPVEGATKNRVRLVITSETITMS